jgi:endonuclease-3 related protein
MKSFYDKLFSLYGPQGWWPLQELDNSKKMEITKSGSLHGYHPGDYSYPKTSDQRFEICLGAILTQNTAWENVDKALINLKKRNALCISGIKKLSDGKLRELIKPAGHYNSKAKYIREFVSFFEQIEDIPSRDELLAVKGIGPETADSMLLYAFNQPVFVVDAYTKRILLHHKKIDSKMGYDNIQNIFHSSLAPDVATYQEFHALLVEHAKRFYKKKPFSDPISLGR